MCVEILLFFQSNSDDIDWGEYKIVGTCQDIEKRYFRLTTVCIKTRLEAAFLVNQKLLQRSPDSSFLWIWCCKNGIQVCTQWFLSPWVIVWRDECHSKFCDKISQNLCLTLRSCAKWILLHTQSWNKLLLANNLWRLCWRNKRMFSCHKAHNPATVGPISVLQNSLQMADSLFFTVSLAEFLSNAFKCYFASIQIRRHGVHRVVVRHALGFQAFVLCSVIAHCTTVALEKDSSLIASH